jgi:hypothetical protein
VADIYTAFMQQIVDVKEGQRETDVDHDDQTHDLGAGFEIGEAAAFARPGTPFSALPRLKRSSSDGTAAEASHRGTGSLVPNYFRHRPSDPMLF